MKLLDNIKAAIALKRGADQIRKDLAMNNYAPLKSLKAGLLQILTLLKSAIIVAVIGVLSDSEAIKKVLINAGANEVYVGVLLLGVAGLARVLQNWYKHSPSSPSQTPTTMVGIFALFLLAPPAAAQDKEFDLFEYLKAHAYVSGGPLVLDAENHTVYEVRLVDDFKISDQFRGAARVSLFSLTRAGEQAPPPKIPTTIREASEAYSDGEVWLSVYRPFKPWLALECIGGLTFKMASLSGAKGDPLDGTKAAFGCGPRFLYRNYHVSLIPSHYGPVADKGKLLGPAPSLLIHAHIPLTFMGKNTAFTPDAAFGAKAPDEGDPDKRRDLTKSLRLLISTRF